MSLFFQSGIDAGFENDLKRMNTKYNKFTATSKRNSASISSGFGDIGNSIRNLVAIGGLTAAGNAIIKLADTVYNYRIEVAKLTDLQGQGLNDFAASLSATADTFDKDAKELSLSVTNLAKGMGISFEDALEKVNNGFIEGADGSEVFLDTLKEYSPLMKEAGLSADQFIGIITQQVKEGIYSDKGIDAIKEAGLALREMTKATAEAIDGLGLSSVDMQKQLSEGTLSTLDAMKLVSTKMDELPPQSAAVGTAIADIFKGAGEDAGLSFLLTLKDINTEFNEVSETLTETEKQERDLLTVNQELQKAISGLMPDGNPLKDLQIAAKEAIIWLIENKDVILDIGKAIIVWKTSTIALNVAQKVQAKMMLTNIRAMRLSSLSGKTVTAGNYAMAKSFKAINTAVKANPIGVILTALTLVIPLIASFASGTDDAADKQNKFNKALQGTNTLLKEYNKIQGQQEFIGGFSLSQLKDQKNEIEQRLKAEEQFVVALKVEANKIIKSDKEVARLRATIIQDANTDLEKQYNASANRQIQLRKEAIVNAHDVEFRASKRRIADLKNDLVETQELIDKGGKPKDETNADAEKKRKASLASLELEHQNNINEIKRHQQEVVQSNKVFQSKLLTNQLDYLNKKQKLAKTELAKSKIQGQIIDVGFQVAELNETDPIKALELAYSKQVLLLRVTNSKKARETSLFHIKMLKAEKAYLQKRKKLVSTENEKIDIDSQLANLHELLSEEELMYADSQRDRVSKIEDANNEIASLHAKLQTEITNQEAAEIQERIRQQEEYINSLQLFDPTETAGNMAEAANTITEAFSIGSQNLDEDLAVLADSIVGIFSTLSEINLEEGATGAQITSIISAIYQIGDAISDKIIDGWSDAVVAQDGYNQSMADSITFQTTLNNLLREQADIERNYSAFLSPDYKQEYAAALKQVDQSQSTINRSISQLQTGLTLTATGVGDSLISNASEQYSFTLDEIINGINESKYTAGTVGSLIIDPLDISGTAASHEAYVDAYNKVEKAYNSALTSMGKTTADMANFSTDEWSTFYTLLDEGGHIVDEGTKALVDAMKTAQEEYAQAMEQMKAVIADVAGSLGDSLADSMVTSIRDGVDALDDFEKSLNNVLLSMATAQMNELFFRGIFDDLQREMEESMAGGDRNWEDDILRFYDKLPPAIDQAGAFLEGFDEQMKDLGFDGVDGSVTGGASSSVAGQIQQAITEETGSELVGRLGAIMLSNQLIANNSDTMLDYAITSLLYQKEIAENTSVLPTIDDNIRKLNDKF